MLSRSSAHSTPSYIYVHGGESEVVFVYVWIYIFIAAFVVVWMSNDTVLWLR